MSTRNPIGNGRTVLAAIGPLCAVLVTAGCGSFGGPASRVVTQTVTQPAAATTAAATTTAVPDQNPTGTSPTEATDVASPPAPGAVKPGTRLKFGQPALISGSYAKIPATVTLTVTGITKGTVADLAPLKLGDRAKGMTPYYVRVRVTNQGTTDLAYASLDTGIKGLLPDGSRAVDLTVLGTFAPCKSASAPRAFTQGKSYDSCQVALAPAGTAVTAGAWIGIGLTNTQPEFYDKPVVWGA